MHHNARGNVLYLLPFCTTSRTKHAVIACSALAAVMALVGCATAPRVDLPPPFDQGGLRIAVEGFYKMGGSYVGLSGTARNTSGEDLGMCMIHFDVLDGDGAKVGDAMASTSGLRRGQEWKFQALFTTPFATTFKAIRPGRVDTLPASLMK